LELEVLEALLRQRMLQMALEEGLEQQHLLEQIL
jgi:hypothetical protein